jgi:hypothetical protein
MKRPVCTPPPEIAALAAAAVAPGPALAHGPCGCLAPREGPPGTKVHARYPIYKVIFNPDRTAHAASREGYWARECCFRVDAALSETAPIA